MEVNTWGGDWGLASTDVECLQVLTLLKISGVSFTSKKTNNPIFTSQGLPEFRHEKKKLCTFQQILSYLKHKNYIPDPDLSAKEQADSFAYRTMVEQKLFPAIQYLWWVDEKNFETVTRAWYAKVLPFPLNFFYPGHRRRQKEAVIRALCQNLEESADIELEIYREAEKCLTCLSCRLGSNDFFYGSHPSALDSFVYGCLAPLLKAPFPSNVLQNHLKACPNLVNFVTRITQRYFSRESLEYEKAQLHEANSEATKSDAFPNKTRNQILAALFAATAMIWFGTTSGIFSISLNNKVSDDSEDFLDDEESYE